MAPQTVRRTADTATDEIWTALRLVWFAETLGLVARSEHAGVEPAEVSAALDAFARAGVGRHHNSLRVGGSASQRAGVLRDILTVIEDSPMPGQEWKPLTALLGDDLVGRLVGTSTSSIQRYRDRQRPTPDDVAARLHTLALIVADLAGSYNEFGLRRWFRRPRSALGARSPLEVLSGDWSPDDDSVHTVRELARSLLGSPAT